MKRTLAAISTGILAIGLAVVGVSGSASATASTHSVSSAVVRSDATLSTEASADCVSSATWAYTYTGSTASGTITASAPGVAAGTELCTPLYVRAATWNYNLPTSGDNPSWLQTLDSKQDVVVSTVGDPVAYAAPNVTGQCQQHDIYGTFSSAGFADLALPTTLTGPNQPYEPEFLHSALSGKGATGPNFISGPNPTYSSDASAGCNVIGPSTAPAAVTFTDSCGTANDVVAIPTPAAGAHYSYAKTIDTRDATTGAGDVTVVATANTGFTFSDGSTTMSWSHTFLANQCAVVTGDPVSTDPVCSADGTSVVSGFITVLGSTGITYTIRNLADGAVTANDITVLSGPTNLAPGSYTVTATALPGYTITSAMTQFTPLVVAAAPTNCDVQLGTHAELDPVVTGFSPVCTAGTTASGYLEIDPADGVNYFIGGTQLTAADTPMPAGTYVVRAVVADPVENTLNARDPNPMTVTISGLATPCSQLNTLAFNDGSLAFTGGSGPSGYLIASAILLLLGGALIAMRARRNPGRGSE
jgi:hypothetical protein